MNQKELAARLKKAREALGVSQQEAAKAVDIPRTAITQIESGKRSVSTLELSKLAKLYNQSISYFFEKEADMHEELSNTLFRSKANLMKSPKFKKQIMHYINLCKEGLILEKLLQFRLRIGPPSYSLLAPKTKSEAVAQGISAAEQERNRLDLGNSAVSDLAALISNQGIWACGADLPDEVSGLFLNNIKTGMIILVNASHVRARKRFSYAHEYAHALFDRNENVRISSVENNSELIEVRANAFAAAFLMPAEGIIEVLHSLNKGKPSRDDQLIYDPSMNKEIFIESRSVPFSQNITYQDIAIIAHHFGVSYQATVYRLRSLDLISQSECNILINKDESGRNLLKSIRMLSDLDEKEDKKLWDRELIGELVYLAIEAFRRNEISRGRVFELGDELGIGGKNLYDFAIDTIDNNIESGACEVEQEKNVKC